MSEILKQTTKKCQILIFAPQESVPVLACDWLRFLISFFLTNTIERSRITQTGVGSLRIVNTIGRTKEWFVTSESYEPLPRLPPHAHIPLPMPGGSTWKFDCKLKLSRSALLKKKKTEKTEKKRFIYIRRKKEKTFYLYIVLLSSFWDRLRSFRIL